MSPYKPNIQQVLCLLIGSLPNYDKPIHHGLVGELSPAQVLLMARHLLSFVGKL
jgi:hypothetical protein